MQTTLILPQDAQSSIELEMQVAQAAIDEANKKLALLKEMKEQKTKPMNEGALGEEFQEFMKFKAMQAKLKSKDEVQVERPMAHANLARRAASKTWYVISEVLAPRFTHHWKFWTIVAVLMGFMFTLYQVGTSGIKSQNQDEVRQSDLKSNLRGGRVPDQSFMQGAQRAGESELETANLKMSGKLDTNKLKSLFNTSTNAVSAGSKRRIWVFADPHCSACRSLESTLNRLVESKEIQVSYLPTPLLGQASAVAVTQIICDANPLRAWKTVVGDGAIQTPNETEADRNKVRECAKSTLALANAFKDFGLNGTPTIIAHDGRYTTGAMNDEELIAWIDGKESKQSPTNSIASAN